MSSITAVGLVPQGFGYVGAAIMSSVWLIASQSAIVGMKRKKAQVEYPQAYATKEHQEKSKDALIFNCAQRAHQNTLEVIPLLWASTIVTGLQYPVPAAAGCFAFVLSRIMYTRGYLTGDPKRRGGIINGLGEAALISLIFAGTWVSGNWALVNFRAGH
ncbi:hypothetical protein BKA70DRAFT_1250950 [Coprinopsis sp. MPI-PUGE-AT-0042]|nr:hypothetical protein BKA70DRAFT_1250950 [Coprinopsis sp. MPI-PUGE-AT-0042]